VKIGDDEGVSPSSSVITPEVPVICFSPRVMYYCMYFTVEVR
jgi:hypothetical protein